MWPQSTVKQQGPGFYRHKMGDLLITALYDGFINLPPALFHGLKADEMQTRVSREVQTPDGLPTDITAYLIDDGSDLVLIDAGGDKWRGPAMGGLLENMKAAGYWPESVSAILLTHLHFDHVCGLNDAECRPAFPNAAVYASEDECRFWLTPQPQLTATKENRTFFHIATRAVAPYRNKRAFFEFKDGDEIRPGIKALLTPGHSPGHTSFLVSSGRDRLLLWGDIVLSAALQLPCPQVSNDYDFDQAQAAATRLSIFKKVIEENWLVGGGHLPFPGLGRLVEKEPGYGWAPL
ncbi:MBL fold metallo-hydrolase [Deltaproteobacteria bacterium OttesenSCG-928-K17]|nr:MBL fold metallo-hydrolase [Deltaproteobacteria bacterium OttesenSCG-928-K17]